jgi:cyclopropane-fatty-acyl-phospholipid synthase
MIRSLLALKGRYLRGGTLRFLLPDGDAVEVGQGEPKAAIRVRDRSVLARIALKPEIAFGETYVDGGWEPHDASLLDVLEVCMKLLTEREARASISRVALGSWRERNDAPRSRLNASHHYDRDPFLYRGFLDRDLHYSCAYFARHGMDLDAAQQAKCALIARKLCLRPGARVLDIGCGFGSLAMYLVSEHHVRVLGITLSREQQREAEARVRERGLTSHVEIRLADYRDLHDKFDAVVSVGMFEHVGRPQYRGYFHAVHDLLMADGVALIHTIGRSGPPAATNPWIRRYIFPGGYIPAASEMMAAIERSALAMTDWEVWRGHYAETLRHWHVRFQHKRGDFLARFGERFCRMWEFYLQCSEAAFRWSDLVVFQAQLARDPLRVPTTRDYLYVPDRRIERSDTSPARLEETYA